MDMRLGKFTDREIALMMGSLNTGETNMATRLVCEASQRLMRAGGAALNEEEDELIDELMTSEYRLRNARRKQRRCKSNSVRKGDFGKLPEPLPVRSRSAKSSTRPRLVVMKKSL